MFWNIGMIILAVLWTLGMVYNYKLGGAIHLFLAGAIVMMFFALRQWWRRPA